MNRKETENLLKIIPLRQAIMLRGIHGVGKSQFLRKFYERLGYKVYVFFGATAEDAGDITGLPDKDIVEYTFIDDNGVSHTKKEKRTVFNAPYWLPTDPKAKLLIFLDEINRANSAVLNCFMNMILNREHNGQPLGENVKIVAGINPSEEGDYEVNKTDKAFNDRFKIIDFHPDVEEWLDYGYSQGYHPEVLEFISRNTSYLDPNLEDDAIVQPSRRSWEDVSTTMLENPDIDDQTFYNYLAVSVGIPAKTAYMNFKTSKDRNLYAKNLLLDFNKEMEVIVKSMSTTEICYFNLELYYWFERNLDIWTPNSKESETIFNNLYRYLGMVGDEYSVQFIAKVSDNFHKSGVASVGSVTWPNIFQAKDKRFDAIQIRLICGTDD